MAKIFTSASIPQSPERRATASGGIPSHRIVGAGSGSRSKNKGSTITMDHGVRAMKTFPITEGEMSNFFWVGSFVTISFSIASGLLGFGLSIEQSLDFSQGIPSHVTDYWGKLQQIVYMAGGVFGAIGVALIVFGHGSRSRIKNETRFENK